MNLRSSFGILLLLWAASANAEGPRCADGVPKRGEALVVGVLPGTNRALAVMDCSASDSTQMETVLAMFTDETTPVCHAPVKLMDQSGNFFLGKIKSIEARPLADGSQVAAISLAGGEANHFWTSQSFIRVDEKCGLTQLAKFYSRMHYDEDDGSKCEGAKHTYKFVEGATVELRREKIHCEPTREVVTVETKAFDLDKLWRDPELRIMEP